MRADVFLVYFMQGPFLCKICKMISSCISTGGVSTSRQLSTVFYARAIFMQDDFVLHTGGEGVGTLRMQDILTKVKKKQPPACVPVKLSGEIVIFLALLRWFYDLD